MRWYISIFTADGKRLVFAASSDSIKEIQALATEARAASIRLQIFIRAPTGQVSAWD
jgi:hypothetical protein